MYYCEKKTKQVEEKILAKKKKNENEICPGTAANKDNIGCNNCYIQSENPKTKLLKIGKKHTIKSLHGNEILQKKLS